MWWLAGLAALWWAEVVESRRRDSVAGYQRPVPSTQGDMSLTLWNQYSRGSYAADAAGPPGEAPVNAPAPPEPLPPELPPLEPPPPELPPELPPLPPLPAPAPLPPVFVPDQSSRGPQGRGRGRGLLSQL